MIRKLLSFLALTGTVLFVCGASFAGAVSSVDLIEGAKDYDEREVVYSGEVVGDIMTRKEYAWINVHDGKNAVGIWIEKALTKDIQYTGSYSARGDRIEITGIFHRSCRQHGGDLDIHALSITKVSSGEKISHPVDKRAIGFSLGLFCMVVAFLAAKYFLPKALKRL